MLVEKFRVTRSEPPIPYSYFVRRSTSSGSSNHRGDGVRMMYRPQYIARQSRPQTPRVTTRYRQEMPPPVRPNRSRGDGSLPSRAERSRGHGSSVRPRGHADRTRSRNSGPRSADSPSARGSVRSALSRGGLQHVPRPRSVPEVDLTSTTGDSETPARSMTPEPPRVPPPRMPPPRASRSPRPAAVLSTRDRGDGPVRLPVKLRDFHASDDESNESRERRYRERASVELPPEGIILRPAAPPAVRGDGPTTVRGDGPVELHSARSDVGTIGVCNFAFKDADVDPLPLTQDRLLQDLMTAPGQIIFVQSCPPQLYSRVADRGQPCFPKGTLVTSAIQ